MTETQRKLIQSLIDEGYKRLHSPRGILSFGTFLESENLLNDIQNYPHFYVLGCVMDRQIKAEKAWIISYKISCEINSPNFVDFLHLTKQDLVSLFAKNKYHRFNNTMAECFYDAIQDIHTKYDDDASNIWANKPKSIDVIRRFDDLKGVGIKIANMAVNILVRDYKIPMIDYSDIDIPPDSQVRKFFIKNNFLNENASNQDIINLARKLHPEFPGILDIAWEEGRKI